MHILNSNMVIIIVAILAIILIRLMRYLMNPIDPIIENYSGCGSCTLKPNLKPPFSNKSMLVPHPRYEWSYDPQQYHCNSQTVDYNPFNGRAFNNQNHTYNPLGLTSNYSLHGIMPNEQLFHVKNRMAPTKSKLYSQEIVKIPTFPM